MIRADLERLVASHNEPRLSVLSVLQEPDVAGSALLPLGTLLYELEELGAHLECLLLGLLIGLDFNLLGEVDDGFEVDVLGFRGLVGVLWPPSSRV